MAEAYIVESVRTAVGRRRGALAEVHPVDLAAFALRELMERSGVDPAAVEDVIMGCLDNIGPQAGCIARTSWLAAGLPEGTPGVTLDRQCGSSQQAVHFAAQAVMSGTADLVVAAGVQNMSMIPMGSSALAGESLGLGTDSLARSIGWHDRYGDTPVSQFHGAEQIAAQWGIGREEMEAYALRSHERALAAIDAGKFKEEIAPFGDFETDEGPRRGSTPETLAALKPLSPGGRLTAAVSSQISDGSAAILVASERAVKEHNLTPLARVHQMSVVGSDPILMLTGPIPATHRALERSGLRLDEIGVFEVNEAFASVVLAWQREFDVDPADLNPNGGAIALGHPIGASGARIMTSMLQEMRRRGARYGLQTMCEGGGQANATVLELLT
ncbi:acetyl-CoA C-acetyltransferase [Jatrophihabitans sp. GAS493]|uniref:acetyl-CoA C-acetyltransferase n=1 Tax=Jatrophihabitans sp. GAS493 TaxID=1907575 RepID=UPI000BB6BAA9|nr:acetyl-CoA C-acetyltransferase [Jatrophihabitans sp. GAS493]SOD74661.1 acetyl-CoA C-acetyltransferase [Jatrophihabitans sp. GAS493]